MFGRVRQVALPVGGRATRTGGEVCYPNCFVIHCNLYFLAYKSYTLYRVYNSINSLFAVPKVNGHCTNFALLGPIACSA